MSVICSVLAPRVMLAPLVAPVRFLTLTVPPALEISNVPEFARPELEAMLPPMPMASVPPAPMVVPPV